MSVLDIDKINNKAYTFSEPVYITENSYIKSIELKKLSWLNKNQNDVYFSSHELHNNDIKNDNIDFIYTLFPNSVHIPFSANLNTRIDETKKQISSGVEYIFDATFYFNNILVVIDILKIDKKKICLSKISSAIEISDMDIESMSLQYYVLKELGYNVKNCEVIYVDGTYIRSSRFELDKLFCIENVKDKVLNLQKTVPKNILEFKALHCEIIERDFHKNIQNKIPKKSIFNLFKLGSQKQIQLYSKGIIDIDKIPNDFSLTKTQQKIVQVYKTNKTFIDNNKIKEFVDTLKYPIFHLSINTYTSLIPEFEDVVPYQKIPYQYSLDIEYKDGTIEHRECLCDHLIDPRFELAKKLCEDIPLDSTVLVYDQDIIDRVIRTLASPYNGKSLHLMNIVKNMKDLMMPFKKNYYISPLQNVNCDLNSVCCALTPELLEKENIESVKNTSELDTLASVKILDKLRKL